MTRKLARKVGTNECGRCGQPHHGYTVKVDADGQEYVVCGVQHKKILVGPKEQAGEFRHALFYTEWHDEPHD